LLEWMRRRLKNSPLPIGEGILGMIAEQKVGEIVNNAENDPRARIIEGTQKVCMNT
jgi:hypothetical protein